MSYSGCIYTLSNIREPEGRTILRQLVQASTEQFYRVFMKIALTEFGYNSELEKSSNAKSNASAPLGTATSGEIPIFSIKRPST
jgi:hypothetical protein